MRDERTAVIYHTSDIHGRLGFAAQLERLVEPGALLVDCGDALAGSSTVYRSREPVVEELNDAPYCALAVGNREFHYLHRCMLARAHLLRAPLVCSNLVDLRSRGRAFRREVTSEAGALRVRFLALLAPQYRTGSGWEKIFGWRFLSADAALDEAMSTGSSSDLTVLLSHMGLAADRQIAQRWPSLHAIIGGHSHDTLQRPEFVGRVPIVHAGAYARHVGRLSLRAAADVSLVSYELLPLQQR
ncbi:MAG: hypothetical protein DLM53_01910 [Candidatus Eremiobacter antarcticus]|nr:metallophosphoesterase [Candidatus Eremiobacteraeota bacterium]PZR63556.1 MAG: hypothetical protein DLM53_01910 [Candidatus Eremiobacter sp. RRmetagenome_bin22]